MASSKLVLAPIVGGRVQGKLTLQEGSEVTGNRYGADVLSRVFFGFTSEIYKLLPIRGVTKDKWLPNFVCEDYKVTEERGGTAIARVTYIGLVKGLPLPKVDGGWSEQTASVSTTILEGAFYNGAVICSGTGSLSPNGYLMVPSNSTTPKNGIPSGYYVPQLEDSGEASVSYNAPETTYTYITNKEPTGPIYSDQLIITNSNFQINEVRPATIIGRIVYALITRTSKFDVSRQGKYWSVIETTRGVMSSAMQIAGGFSETGSDTLNQFSQKLQQFQKQQFNPNNYR